MTAKIIFLIFGLVKTVITIQYKSKIVSQRVSHYENEFVDFDVKYYGDEGYPYLIIKETISPYNDLHLMLYARVYDQSPNLLTSIPLSLCKLLHDVDLKKNFTLMQFNIPQIYNFDGKNCPIEQGIIRLTPYMFPAKFETEANLGCGYMNIESRLLKCSEDNDSRRACTTLMKTVSLAFLLNESCTVAEKDIPDWIGVEPLAASASLT